MKLSFQNALSFYLTGRLEHKSSSEKANLDYTNQELDDFEMNRKEFENYENECVTYKNPLLNDRADLNTLDGQFRLGGLGVVNSLFSGIGVKLASKLSFASGLLAAAGSLGFSFIKNNGILDSKHSLFSVGGNLIRGPLHMLDSVFSSVGEQGSKFTLPSILAGGVSVFSLGRTLKGTDNKSFELPNNTISGTLGRTAVHHMDSMLASKGTEIFSNSQGLGSFLASSLTTFGLLMPENLRKKEIPWKTLEGFVAQGGTHFVDSLFSSLGNGLTSSFGDGKKMLLGGAGLAASIPLASSLLSNLSYKIPFGTFEGRIVRGIFHAPESLVFNLGSMVGSGGLGLPLTMGFAGLTYLTCVSKKGKNLFKNFSISRDSLSGLVQRLPFDFIYSMISSSARKIGALVPAPVLTLIGPALSFQIGEKLKNVETKFDDLKGLMLRNSVHLWESVLSQSAYRTGRMVTGTLDEDISSGSLLSDGRWLSDDGRIVSTMAIGKQLKEHSEINFKNLLLTTLGGIGFAFASSKVFKHVIGQESQKTNVPDVKPPEEQKISLASLPRENILLERNFLLEAG